MALGSSAPEILLGIIEIVFAQQFYAGSLGPSTIVGSAAFNLLIIVGVCTISLKSYKRISRHGVYIVTAVFSVFAYLWIVIVTQGKVADLPACCICFPFPPFFFFLFLVVVWGCGGPILGVVV